MVVVGRGWRIEQARSGRSRCRSCRKTIEHRSLRVGLGDPLSSSVRWAHPQCAGRTEPLVVAELLEHAKRASDYPALVALARRPYALDADTSQLERRVHAGEWGPVATDLRSLWWTTRAPVVARALSMLGSHHGPRPPASGLLEWVRLQDASCALRAGQRIRGIGRLTRPQLVHYLRSSLSEPPDPRWTELVCSWLEQPGFRLDPALWDAVMAVVDRLADPRALPVLSGLRRLGRTGLRARFGGLGPALVLPWVNSRVDGYPTVTAPFRELTEAERARVVRLTERLACLASEPKQGADVRRAASSGDDQALLVLADAWTAADDPRGLFIQLEQLGRRRSAAQRAGRKALLADWRSLVGEVSPMVLRDQLRFERGLMVRCAIRCPRSQDEPGFLASSDWVAVRELELRANPLGQVPTSFVFAPQAHRLERVTVPSLEDLFTLLAADGVQAGVTEVLVRSADRGRWAPTRSRSLPALVRVRIERGPLNGLVSALPHVQVERA